MGESLSAVLPESLGLVSRGSERGFCQELCYGSLRWHERLQAVLSRLLEKPLKPQDRDLASLIVLGLYQLSHLDVPAYAAVAGTVSAAAELDKPWARGLVNAVLRRYQREQSVLLEEIDRSPARRHACPEWLYRRIVGAYPDASENILVALNARPPMTLRVNTMLIDRNTYLTRLQRAGIAAEPHPLAPEAVVLSEPRSVQDLPGFAEGVISVQDAGAQLAAHLLEARPGMAVLDACAAPGGKTSHILELARGDVNLVALDRDAQRIERIRTGLQRLGLRARIVHADACEPASWWDGIRYERILLDAPCSASGVIRRHPDIKLLRRDSDIGALARDQGRLLEALWPLLAAGGRMLYSTCSIFPEENQDRISAFLSTHADARHIALSHAALDAEGRILPGQNGMDGFFYAAIEKTGS